MFPSPGHGSGILDHGVHSIEQGTIPVLLQNSPAALDRVVLAVVGRIIGQARDAIALHKLHQALYKLGAPTVVLRAIVQIDKQRLDVGKTL